ncbi:MAG TPA: hypothetical protein VE978_23970 [Chitinophagales bacterium]|nr:hypothetical protein [Chitinophagales bacterium]
MKKLPTFIITVAIVTNSFAQAAISADSLDKKLSAYFDEYTPELFRYSGLTFYGEARINFSQDQISKEIQLLNEVKKSDLLNKPTPNVFALCHNIIIHSPSDGKEFLKLLDKPTTDEYIIGLLYSEMIFTGEFGEQLALDNLESTDLTWSKTWANYLSEHAIYESSLPRIEKMLQRTNDNEIKQDLIGALMYISNPKSLEVVKPIIETTKSDEVQSKAIFAFAELAGYEGIQYLESIKTVGANSKEEKKSSEDWLKKETSSKNKFGTELTNDISFIERFGDIKSPAIIWLDKEGLLDEKNANKPTAFTKENKNKFIDLLIESKGFGLEAAKAQLFLSIEYSDIEKLLTLRQMCVYSPNNFTKGRLNTIGIYVRYLRKTAK